MIGGAVLIVGLLLILAGLASAWIPGEATFASSGIFRTPDTDEDETTGPLGLPRRARNPLRAFLLSPIHPQTWYANVAIGIGFFVGIFTFAMLASFASAGFATIVAGVGVVVIALGIEVARDWSRGSSAGASPGASRNGSWRIRIGPARADWSSS